MTDSEIRIIVDALAMKYAKSSHDGEANECRRAFTELMALLPIEIVDRFEMVAQDLERRL